MRKSDIKRTAVGRALPCVYLGRDEIECGKPAEEIVTVTSYPANYPPITGEYALCTAHANAHAAAYESEWKRHPEYFD